MKKRTSIILGSVVAVCGLGVLSSVFLDWPVNADSTGGDIAKSVRFSREEASEKLENMKELLQTDSTFKDAVVTSQVVMQTRAIQFATLVELSNEVAGGIAEFSEVLKELNAAGKIAANANNSLAEACSDLDAALGGKECADLDQHTINAALAYTTLQKQNKLANKFIETTDQYLKKAKGDENLKLIRDQWLEYQLTTAALEGDKESAEALAKKGNLLTAEQTLGALARIPTIYQTSIINSANLNLSLNVNTQLGSAFGAENLINAATAIRNTASTTLNQVNESSSTLQSNTQAQAVFNNAVSTIVRNAAEAALGNKAAGVLGDKAAAATLGNGAAAVLHNIAAQTVQMSAATNVIRSFNEAAINLHLSKGIQNQATSGANLIGHSINNISVGSRPRIPF